MLPALETLFRLFWAIPYDKKPLPQAQRGRWGRFNEKESSLKREDHEELRLTLETERQEVLGKLSFMTPNHKEYEVLDLRFKELTKLINNLQ